MNSFSLIASCALLGAVASGDFTLGASVLLDDLSGGPYVIAAGGSTSTSASISSPVFSTRRTAGYGLPDWSASVKNGVLTYSTDLANPPDGVTFLRLGYTRTSGTFDFSGFNSLVFLVSGFVGAGEIVLDFGVPGGTSSAPISSSGSIAVPLPTATMPDLTAVNSLAIKVVPLTADFAVTIDSISAVPEASVFSLTGAVFWCLLLRRRINGPERCQPK